MKRFLFMSALASVALASCVNDEAMENTSKASDQKITFNAPVVSGTTRAVAGEQPNVETQKYSTAEKFRVYAQWDSDGNFDEWVSSASENAALYMSDVEVAYDGNVTNGAWSSDAVDGGDVYYWPKEGGLTFAAYSPSDVYSFEHSYSNTGLSVTGFTVQAETKNQYDFMYSDLSKDRTESKNASEEKEGQTHQSFSGVDILFKHALSSIKFKVKTEGEYVNTRVQVKQITILNAYSKGDFKQNLNETDSDGNAVLPTWSNWDVRTNYAVKSETTNQVLTSDVASLVGANDVILLPQSLGGSSDAEKVKVKVDYSITHGNSTDGFGHELPQTTVLELATDNVSSWEMGKRYIYTIIIGLDKIYFSPEVVDWVDVTVTPDLTI